AMHGGQNDWTALHWAAAEGRQVLCARLLRDNADPAQADDTGTPGANVQGQVLHEGTCTDFLAEIAHPILCFLPAIVATAIEALKADGLTLIWQCQPSFCGFA
ncbi:unnamed protein product, partial [Durusdinium trenchii]